MKVTKDSIIGDVLDANRDTAQFFFAECMGIDEDCVSIKATTTEKLGFVGRKEGIAAYCVALICKE